MLWLQLCAPTPPSKTHELLIKCPIVVVVVNELQIIWWFLLGFIYSLILIIFHLFIHQKLVLCLNASDVRVCRRIPGYFRCGGLQCMKIALWACGVVSAKGQTEKLGWVGLTLENVSSTSIRGMVFKAGVWRDIVQMWRLRSHQIAQIYQSGKELSAQNSGVREPEEDQGQTSQFPTRSLMPHGFWYHMS